MRFEHGSANQILEEQEEQKNDSFASSEISEQKNYFIGQKISIDKDQLQIDLGNNSFDKIASMSKRRTESFTVH